MKKEKFGTFHPLVSFSFFLAAAVFTMIFNHPVLLAVSFAGAAGLNLCLRGGRALLSGLKFVLPLMLFTFLLNPLFNHEGMTILFYMPGGNPVTAESIAYGGSAAVMLASEICWFSCLNEIMTTDKYICLFGKTMPSLSLALSMILRFVPHLKVQLNAIKTAQSRVAVSTGAVARAKKGLSVYGALLTMAFENAVDTADSMRSRGWGQRGRTSYSLFVFENRDAAALTFILVNAAFLIALSALGSVHWQFFPYVDGTLSGAGTAAAVLSYCGICFMPLAIDLFGKVRRRV